MLNLTPEYVTGFITQAGTGNPVVLESRQQELVQRLQPARIGSLAYLVIGGILTVTILGAILGIPMLAVAGWVHWKVRNSLKVIDEAYRALASAAAGRPARPARRREQTDDAGTRDRKSTRLNSRHVNTS